MNKFHFWILIRIVAISGFSQGMLLPLIAIIFEQDCVSATLNGLHATALYIGILIISPFMEQPLRKYGKGRGNELLSYYKCSADGHFLLY